MSHKTKAVKFQIQTNFSGCCKQVKMEVEMKLPFTFEGELLQFDVKGPNGDASFWFLKGRTFQENTVW